MDNLDKISDNISEMDPSAHYDMSESEEEDLDSEVDPEEYETKSMRSRHRKLHKLPIPSHFRHL